MMKRLISLLLALALTPVCALAESDYVTLPELSVQAQDGWSETFTAQGREVKVAVDTIHMPVADACPVLEVEGLGKVDVAEGALEQYQGKKGVDVYSFDCSLTVDVWLEDVYAPGANGSYVGKRDYDQPYTEWFYGEEPTFQPENVDLTYEQFLQKVEDEVQQLFGLTPEGFRTRCVSAYGVAYMAKENKQGELIRGKQYTRWGSFCAEFEQLFHGIPVVGSSGSWQTTPKGTVTFSYLNKDCFYLTVSCSRETGMREADVPLLSFDAMKRILTVQIESGNLRGVDDMEFGYLAMYEGRLKDNRWLLVPVWRVHGGYTKNVKQEHVMPYESAKDGGHVVPQEYGDYFYNAQTGEMLPTDYLVQNGIDNPLQVGEILTWDGVTR